MQFYNVGAKFALLTSPWGFQYKTQSKGCQGQKSKFYKNVSRFGVGGARKLLSTDLKTSMHSLLTKKFKRGCLIQFSRFWTKHFSDSFFWCDFCMLCWYFVGIMVEIRVSRNNFSLVAKNAPMLGVGGARKLLSIDLQTSMHSLITKKFRRGCLIQFLRFLTKHLAEIAVFLLSWESHSSCRFKGWHGQK